MLPQKLGLGLLMSWVLRYSWSLFWGSTAADHCQNTSHESFVPFPKVLPERDHSSIQCWKLAWDNFLKSCTVSSGHLLPLCYYPNCNHPVIRAMLLGHLPSGSKSWSGAWLHAHLPHPISIDPAPVLDLCVDGLCLDVIECCNME